VGEQAEAAPEVARVGYAPITRVDAERREIELCATSETLDAHGTIFDYAASKEAFTRWLGNVREMHERRAVGRRVAVRCDDAARRIIVRLRISRGAQDTWEKVLDGTLRGASIGASDVVWRRERRAVAGRSRWVQVATRYDLAELSLVDNPSNPDALGVTFVRGAEPDTALLDPLPDAPLDAPAEQSGEQPGEQPMEARERQPLHEATRTLLTGCACPRCAVALAALAEDDTPEAHGGEAHSGEASDHEPLTRALLAAVRATSARLAALDATLGAAIATLRADDTRRAAPAPAHDEAASAEAARVVNELRARVARLEAQPVPGGPAARAVEKTLLGAPVAAAEGAADVEYRTLEALAGRLRDPQAQLAVAAEMIRLQQSGAQR
jgi:phage head maturation protease